MNFLTTRWWIFRAYLRSGFKPYWRDILAGFCLGVAFGLVLCLYILRMTGALVWGN